MRHHQTDKENQHPNIQRKTFKVKEEDFSAIGKQYVLEGQRLRVKSIRYRQEPRMQPEPVEINMVEPEINIEQISDKDIQRLEYLQEMDVINEEEKTILQAVRKSRNMNQIPITQQSRYAKPKNKIQGHNNFIPTKLGLNPPIEQQQDVGYYKPYGNNYY